MFSPFFLWLGNTLCIEAIVVRRWRFCQKDKKKAINHQATLNDQ